MDAPDELVEAVARAIWEHDGPFLLWRQLTEPVKEMSRERARAVLSVPALAEVIARDVKVREIVAEWRALANTPPNVDIAGAINGHVNALAALYPEAGKPDDSDIMPGSEFDGPVVL